MARDYYTIVRHAWAPPTVSQVGYWYAQIHLPGGDSLVSAHDRIKDQLTNINGDQLDSIKYTIIKTVLTETTVETLTGADLTFLLLKSDI